MPKNDSDGPGRIQCPVRKRVLSSLMCHDCPNHIRVLFRSEIPLELQCAKWDWEQYLGRPDDMARPGLID